VSRFAFVAAERANHAVAALCRVVGASVSGFYAWLHAIPSSNIAPRRKPRCGAISVEFSWRGAGFTACLGSTPNCAAKVVSARGTSSG
jgi:hypothetical protein